MYFKHCCARAVRTVLASAFVAAFLTTAALAKGSLFSGKVSLGDAQNVTGAEVVLRNTSNGTVAARTSADKDGYYELASADAGKFIVEISADGYLTAKTSTVTVSSANLVSVPEIKLVGGDINGDGKVDINDRFAMYRAVADKRFTNSWLVAACDINRDGVCDDNDLALLNDSFGKTVQKVNVPSYAVSELRTNNYAAYQLMAESSYLTVNTMDRDGLMQSGWAYDNRGSVPKDADNLPYQLLDISAQEGTAYVRELTPTGKGRLVLNTAMGINGNGGNGAGIMFYCDKTDTAVYELFSSDSKMCIRAKNGSLVPLDFAVNDAVTVRIRVELDLDKGISKTWLGGKYMGEHELLGNYITNFKFFTGKEADNIAIFPGAIYCDVNYAVKEMFSYTDDNGLPYNWSFSSDSGAKTEILNGELCLKPGTNTGSKASASASFDRVSGRVNAECLQYMDTLNDGFEMSLKYNGKNVVRLYVSGSKFYANGKELREYGRIINKIRYTEFWNVLRIEADTDTNKADIKINGKVVGTVDFLCNAPYFDSLSFSSQSNGNNYTVRLDEVVVYQVQKVDDYVPEPVVPKDSNGYYVGMNMCNLWQNGEHWGWDNITPFDEVRPVLGYYDEDNSEVADWEIKFMAEHGVDYQAICWYGSSSNSPIKSTRYGGGLDKGFLNAKYSNYMDFAILWEAANAAIPQNMDAWKNYFVPYWMDYYLSDPRYARIDNKAVIGVFGADKLCYRDDFSLKEAFDYLEDACREIGYDGCIFMACSTTSSASVQSTLSVSGFDCIYAYNYGKEGYNPTYTINSHTSQHKTGNIHVLPTISVGFNNVAWGGRRSPNMTTDDMHTMSQWVKNTAFGNWYKNSSENWKKKLMMFSTWNEYGEGTYIMPSGLNGFGYLDVIKSEFTDNDTACTDVTPTENQISRLGCLFPNDRQMPRATFNGVRALPETPSGTTAFSKSFASGTSFNSSAFNSVGGMEYSYDASQQAMRFTVTGADPMVSVKNVSLSASSAAGITVRAKVPKNTDLSIYFATSANPTLSESMKVTVIADTSDWKEYYFNMSDNGYWQGTITQLRFDPGSGNINATLYFDKLTAVTSMQFKVYIDTVEYITDTYPVSQDGKDIAKTGTEPYITDNGTTLFPFNPYRGVNYMLKTYYTWDRNEKALRLRGHGADIIYTMGSKTALLNGKPQTLTDAPVFNDGVPMIPLEHMISCFGDGFSVEKSVNADKTVTTIRVSTPWSDFWKYKSRADDLMWEFNQIGNFEGWGYSSCSMISKNEGTIVGNSIESGTQAGHYDPIMSVDVNFSPADYDKIVIRMKYNVADSNIAQIFYKAEKGGVTYDCSESRSARVMLNKGLSLGFKELVFDFSKDATFKSMDKITYLRFDPIACAGTFEIDYIRVYPSESKTTLNTSSRFETFGFSNTQNTSTSGNKIYGEAKYFNVAGRNDHYDPMFEIPNIKLATDYYNTVDVTMKYTINDDKTTLSMFFVSDGVTTSHEAARRVAVELNKSDGANYKTYTLDLSSNSYWNSSFFAKKFRFDPIECSGSFEITSIRFYHK